MAAKAVVIQRCYAKKGMRLNRVILGLIDTSLLVFLSEKFGAEQGHEAVSIVKRGEGRFLWVGVSNSCLTRKAYC